MKIHVTGNAGSGKSTFARKLSNQTSLPLYGLDKIVWQSGWKKNPTDERKCAESVLIAKPEWIIEGVSRDVRNCADLVIFLDRTRVTCAFRCFKRNVPFLFSSRPELPPKCPEILIVPALFKIIYGFPKLAGKTITEESRDPANVGKYVRLTNDREASCFIENFSIESDL